MLIIKWLRIGEVFGMFFGISPVINHYNKMEEDPDQGIDLGDGFGPFIIAKPFLGAEEESSDTIFEMSGPGRFTRSARET